MDWIELGYWGLFLVSFLAATVLPFSSDVVVGAMALGNFNSVWLFLFATAGNWLGGVLMYYAGYLGKADWLHKYAGISQPHIASAKKRVKKYGSYAAFFVWVPIIGDPMAIALGFFRSPVVSTLAWMLLGKALRYAIIILAIKQGVELF